MKLKKLFSMMLVGVVTFMVAASVEISSKVLGGENFRQIRGYFSGFYVAAMSRSEDAWVCMSNWLLVHGYLEPEEKNIKNMYEGEAAMQSRYTKLICEQSGVVIDVREALRLVIVNEKMYRGSG